MKRYPHVPAKVGTVPMQVWLRSRKPYKVGDVIEYRERDRQQWQRGVVTSLDPFRMDKL